MAKEKEISFRLIEIKNEQFAILEENYIDNSEVNLTTSLTFGLNKDEKVFSIVAKYTFDVNSKAFLTIQTTCFFKISDEAFEEFKSKNKVIFPKEFVAHMAMLTVGTTRGILHTKTEGTKFNKFILPTINVATMIPEDIIFD
nr:hypothetical protein [uncultured Flavobacterium sp.]